MSAFSTLETFRDTDRRRRGSTERDFGVWWRAAGQAYRVSYVEATGELIAVRMSHGPRLRTERTMQIATHLPGADVIEDERFEVFVLAVLDEADVGTLLDGWADVCGRGPDSFRWVLDRVAHCGDVLASRPRIHVPDRRTA